MYKTTGTSSIKEHLWNANYCRAWSANFMLYFSFMVLTPLLPLYLSDTFNAEKDIIGLVLSGYAITALLIRPFSGYFVDTFPRKAVLLFFYGLFALLFGGYLVASSLILFAIVRTIHGAPMGAATVANSTVAIDVLASSRRAEGIGYYGLSNNLATAIAPTIGIFLWHWTGSYDAIFIVALVSGLIGWIINTTLRVRTRIPQQRPKLSFDRMFLFAGWPEGISMACFSYSYGVVSTYVAIYAKESLGMEAGTGLFFTILCIGLMLSRLIGAHSLRQGAVVKNATHGVIVSLIGYLLFASVHQSWAMYLSALIIGLGNGHMFPAFQTMFINLASNSQRGTANGTLLTSWDVGMGLGITLGGLLSEAIGYDGAFWSAWITNLAGVVFFFVYVREHYLRHRLQ